MKKRYENLDFLRGLASLGVLVGHSSWIIGLEDLGINTILVQDFSVAIFLSLSGFVIGINYKPYTFEFKDYVSKRFIRIFPLFFTCLLLTFILDFIRFKLSFVNNHFESSTNLSSFITSTLLLDHFFLLQYFTPGSKINLMFEEFGSNRVLWTLSLEWSIYMLYGFLFSKESKTKKKLTILLLPYIMTGCLSYFHTRIPFLSICWILGFIISLKRSHSILLLAVYSATVVVITVFKNNEAIFLLTPIIVHCFNKINFYSSLVAFGNFTGNISFSLYLCHYPIMLLVAPILIGYGQLFSFVTVNLVSLITSVILYYFIDRNRKKLLLKLSISTLR